MLAMKGTAVALTFILAGTLLGCASRKDRQYDTTSVVRRKSAPGPRMTEAQVLALAKPMLPLFAGDSYRRVDFRESTRTWEVSTWPDGGAEVHTWLVVLIRDSDGKVLGVEPLTEFKQHPPSSFTPSP